MKKKYHYTYRITNIKLNKHYYGTRTSKCHPSDDLGIKYFSSSSNKNFILDQKLNSKDYKYKVVKIFSTRKEALELEIKLHNKFNVGINESFYNRCKQTSTGFDTTGTVGHNLNNHNTIRCVHCGQTGQENLMKQWHFDNCLKHPTNYKENIHTRELVSSRKKGKGNPMFDCHGKKNTRSQTYTIFNSLNEVVKICFGSVIKVYIKLIGLPSGFRYQYTRYIVKTCVNNIERRNELKKFEGWYIETSKD